MTTSVLTTVGADNFTIQRTPVIRTAQDEDRVRNNPRITLAEAQAVRKAGKLLAHLHACGCDRGIPGSDHIDWKGIAQALKDIHYEGDIVIESFATHVKLIARAAAIWRQIEPNQEDIATKGLKFLQRIL